MLYMIIENELEKRLNRKPTAQESHDLYINIVDNWEYTDNLTDISNIITDYIANNYTQCEQCGEYHLNKDMQTIGNALRDFTVCNNPDCEQRAYFDSKFDNHELATY